MTYEDVIYQIDFSYIPVKNMILNIWGQELLVKSINDFFELSARRKSGEPLPLLNDNVLLLILSYVMDIPQKKMQSGI